MREPLLIFLPLIISIGQLPAQSPIVRGRVTDGKGNSLAGATVSAVYASAGNVTNTTAKKASRRSDIYARISLNML
jgi:hypothetical protein